MNIKDTKDGQRMHVLSRDLENIHYSLQVRRYLLLSVNFNSEYTGMLFSLI